jgi:hypothetical protein
MDGRVPRHLDRQVEDEIFMLLNRIDFQATAKLGALEMLFRFYQSRRQKLAHIALKQKVVGQMSEQPERNVVVDQIGDQSRVLAMLVEFHRMRPAGKHTFALTVGQTRATQHVLDTKADALTQAETSHHEMDLVAALKWNAGGDHLHIDSRLQQKWQVIRVGQVIEDLHAGGRNQL